MLMEKKDKYCIDITKETNNFIQTTIVKMISIIKWSEY